MADGCNEKVASDVVKGFPKAASIRLRQPQLSCDTKVRDCIQNGSSFSLVGSSSMLAVLATILTLWPYLAS